MRVEVAKEFHPMRFPVPFFLTSNCVQRAKSPPLAFLTCGDDASSVVKKASGGLFAR